jgi:hypothetical protein
VVGASCVRSLARLVDEFASDFIFDAGGEVVELFEAFEQRAAGYRASRGHRFRGVGRVREEDSVHPETGEFGGEEEYWHVRRYESIIRVEKSAGPRSVVDRGAARTRGVWSPRLGEGSSAVPKF